ncbi:hypothetical protein PLESTF_000917800 [Pleodorina starrii]|nr:hypothetical protein PLESTF_000917800 [Pleodorina starrii]
MRTTKNNQPLPDWSNAETASIRDVSFKNATTSCGCTPDNPEGRPVNLTIEQVYDKIEFSWVVGSACETGVSVSRSLVNSTTGELVDTTTISQLSMSLTCGTAYKPARTEINQDIVRDNLQVATRIDTPAPGVRITARIVGSPFVFTAVTDEAGSYQLTLQAHVDSCDPDNAPELCLGQSVDLTASARTKLRNGRVLNHKFSINNRAGGYQRIAMQHVSQAESPGIVDESSLPVSGYVSQFDGSFLVAVGIGSVVEEGGVFAVEQPVYDLVARDVTKRTITIGLIGGNCE